MISILDGYSTENLEFRWNPSPVTRDDRLQLAQFRLGEMRTFQCDKQYVEGEVKIPVTCCNVSEERTTSKMYHVL